MIWSPRKEFERQWNEWIDPGFKPCMPDLRNLTLEDIKNIAEEFFHKGYDYCEEDLRELLDN